MSVLDIFHGKAVYPRRTRSIARAAAQLLPHGATLADVGCGDGLLSRTLIDGRPDVTITGFDVLVRPETHIEVRSYDGSTLPLPDDAVDFSLLVDVVHHADDQAALLREALRVARRGVILKDHLKEGFLAGPTLRLMDWVGNARHGVRLPYNYLTRGEWDRLFEDLGVRVLHFDVDLGLYPAPASWLFGRSLHFIAHISSSGPGATD